MGPELLQEIVKLTNITFDYARQNTGDREILEALKIHLNEGGEVTKINDHIKAAWQIGSSAKQAISIDNVIDALEDPQVELVGKMGIVRSILKAEADSSYFSCINGNSDNIDLSRFDNSWYSSFTKILTENIKKSQVVRIFDNLEIINFNYDRCIEHYLPISIAAYYGLSPDAIREIMNGLTIHRPYGVAGRLPWQRGDSPSVRFGESSPRLLANVAQQVRTFTERVNEGDELAAMRATIAGADRIVFLGFAFHRQNIDLLSQKMEDHAEIVATAYNISKSDVAVIEREISKAFEHKYVMHDTRIELTNMTCHQFFKDYWRTLTAEKGAHEPFQLPNMTPRIPAIPSWPRIET